MIIVVKITLCTSLLSLLSTMMAILIGFTQKAWRKRDGVLFFNIFAVDVIFSCVTMTLCIRLIMLKAGGVTAANIFLFMYLLSWASQCIISTNRYIMVSFPFAFKSILTRGRFCVMILVSITPTFIAMFTSIGMNNTQNTICALNRNGSISNENNCATIICGIVFPYFSPPFLSVIMVAHLLLLLIVYVIECWLWKTAKGHRHRFHSLTSSINGLSKRNSDPNSSPKPNRGEIRKGSLTQSIMKKISLSNQRPPVHVHGTPVFFMAAHLLTVFPYMTLSVFYITNSNDFYMHDIYQKICMAVQLLMSLRPMINVGNHLSTKSLKRFTKLIQKVIHRDSRELFTEYYYENDEEVKTRMMKRKEAIRMRPRNL